MAWQPLSSRLGKKRPAFERPADGIPGHLAQPIADWLSRHFFHTGEHDLYSRGRALDLETVKLAGVMLRVQLDWRAGPRRALESLLEQCSSDGSLFLDLVDLALNRLENTGTAVDELNALLGLGGCNYEVAPDGCGLTTRASETVQAAAVEAIAPGDRASHLLAESWRQVHGRHPNPGIGYREAVRAVEVVACPVVIPNDKLGALGKAIAAMKDAPSKFKVVLEGPGTDPIATVRGMMELIWKSQLDRHGTADEQVPLHVSQQEAEAALQIAITLVEWFRRGFIRRGG